jgi:threonine/homoserine/homoserine lactone efflux protein
LLYLAFDALRSASLAPMTKTEQALRRYFAQGLVSNILNPKAYLFYAAIVPQFADPAAPLMPQLAFLTAVYVAIATLIHCAIAVFSSAFQAVFAQPSWHQTMARIFAALLVAVAVWFYISTGKTA